MLGFILDWIVDIIGALIGRQECSQKVACRAGRLAKEKVPGSQMMVMMVEMVFIFVIVIMVIMVIMVIIVIMVFMFIVVIMGSF